ncbi:MULTISPECIES: DUF6527 family protein [unclassified Parasphingorhabdus]|jgi:hypothetical protein|uniref:DUF6527 family protein n=2 Tax=Sphingomonadaceae TaxID=41297 RepID=UPI0039E44DF2|tara:strand:- start:3366 stop:3731 length:366 start_codon:yes stop_codon:yes gene_type:complete
MRAFFAKTLKRLGWLRFEFQVKREEILPDRASIEPGTMVSVESGKIKKWACMSCPGGCGEMISLSLNPQRRPRWTLVTDFWLRPTIHPSVHQRNACGCHFWLRNGQVHWCKDGRPQPNPMN